MQTMLARRQLEGLADSELLARIAGRDLEAFEVLMRRHNRILYRTARAILRDDHDTEDCVQDVYLNVYRHMDGFREPDLSALRSQWRALLEQKIDLLPDAFRPVFILRAIEEMTVEETALCLQIPEATVRTRYFRARALLRESIANEIDVAMEGLFEFLGARCDRIVEHVLRSVTSPGAAPPLSGP